MNLCVFVLVCLPEKADDKQQEGSAAKTRLSRQLKVFLAKETRACCETTAEKKREKKTAVTPHRRPPLFAAAAAAVFSLSFRELLIVLSTHTLLDLFNLFFFSFFFLQVYTVPRLMATRNVATPFTAKRIVLFL